MFFGGGGVVVEKRCKFKFWTAGVEHRLGKNT
jgi:hypothetical protein